MTDLDKMIAKAMERFGRLSPDEQAAHRRSQRKSWVVGEMMLEHPEMTREEAERLFNQLGF